MEEYIIRFSEEIVMNNKIIAYLFFFVSQGLQILFPPYPGDMILILEGYLSELATLNITFIIINAITATSLASVILYKIGYINGYEILESKIIKKLFDVEKVNKLKIYFNKYGFLVVIMSKFFPGFYSIALLTSGIFKVKKEKVYISILINTSIHHIVLIILGKILGENWILVLKYLDKYSRYFTYIVIMAIVLYLIVFIVRKLIIKRN